MKGNDRFQEILDKNIERPILLYGDPDVDGLVSLLFMCQFCDKLGLKYSYYVNPNRKHGFLLDVEKIKGYMVIASDFTITESEMQNLVNNDVVILSTDHHECQSSFIDVHSDTAEGVVINNQYPFEPEEDRYLSGAGVFYELVCSIYPEFKSIEREALIGVTLLSDVRQIENNKAKKYLRTTYTIDTNIGYINYLVSNCVGTDYGFGMPKLDRNFIDYSLSPKINAMLRFNKTTEAINFILGKGVTSNNCKEVQATLIAEMNEKASVLSLPSVDIVAVNELDFVEYNTSITNFIGLLCSNWKDKHNNKSVLGLVYENGKITRASFRGKYDDVYYLIGFKDLGINAQGHPTAFGIVDFEPTTDLWVQINDLVTDLELSHTPTITVIETTNLALTVTMKGMDIANSNCYVRDMYRTYIKYTGNNIRVNKMTYKKVKFTDDDFISGTIPDEVTRGVNYKYLRDDNGQPIPKYIEYIIDGRTVKSFGVRVEDGGWILPMLDKGYLQLLVHTPIE